MSKALSSFALIAVAVAAAVTTACGGGASSQVEAKTPESAAGEATTQPVATNQSGQQYATGEAPSPNAPEQSNRPKMNAAAQQAYQAGLQAFQSGDLQGAKTQFMRASEADPNAYQAQFSLGVVQERLGSKSAALSAYRASYGVVKDYEPAIAAYALLLAHTGDASEAEDFLNRERAILPASAAVLGSLAEVKSVEKDSASAQQLAQEALKKNPDYRPAMVTLARDHYRNRRLDLALYTLTAILDGYGPENPPRDKDNAEALLLRGLIYKEQGRRRDAFADFKRAVELRPDLVEARLNLAKYMLEAGNATEAVPILEGALNYDTSNPLVHLNLGDGYRLQGRPADALKHLQWVLSKDSTIAEAHYNLGLLYLFSTGVPGTTPTTAIDKAIAELELFKSMRPRAKAGAGDDTDELLSRAKNKKAILAAEAAAPPPEQPAAAAGGTAPAGGAPGQKTGGTTPPNGGVTPAGGTKTTSPPAGAGAGAATPPLTGAGSTAPAGSAAPPATGGAAPPATGSATPPATGGAAPPATGGTKPPSSGAGSKAAFPSK